MNSLSENVMIDEPRAVDDIQNMLRQSITNGINIRMSAYIINAEAEQILKTVMDAVLEKYDATDLGMTTALVVKELTTNAVKANLKHWLMMHGQPARDVASPEFIAEFRKIISSGSIEAYRERLQTASLKVDILLEHGSAGMTLSVSNGFPVQGAEKDRLLAKLNSATDAGDLRNFFDKNKKDAEGAGLGFALMINALKSAGFGAGALTFDADDDAATRARVVFSFKAAKA
jgi:hypothetical protein